MILFKRIFFLILLLFAHISVSNFFNYPINQINVIYLFLLWQIIVKRESKYLIGLAICCGLFIEIYSTMPHGIYLLSLLFAVIFVRWILQNIFSSRSTHIVLLSFLIGLVVYRLFFFSLLAIFFRSNPFAINLNLIYLYNIAWEITLNLFIVLIFYLVTYKFIKALNPAYISLKKKKHYA